MVRKSVWLAIVATGVLIAGRSEALEPPDEYGFEVGARLSGGALSVPFTCYFPKVENSEKPFALQPFFAKTSRVGVNLGLGTTPLDLDVPMLFALPVQEDRLQLTANVNDVLDSGNLAYNVGIGYYCMEDNLRIAIDVIKGGGGASLGLSLDWLTVQYVAEIGDEAALDIQFGSQVAGGILGAYDLGVMYYFNKELGIGVGYNSAAALSVDVSYYLGPLAIVGNYDITNGAIMLGVDFRF